MNRDKITTKMIENSNRVDLETVVSPTGQSVCIVMNTGVYKEVVYNHLENFVVGESIQYQHVSIECTMNRDAADAEKNKLNKVLAFAISSPSLSTTHEVVLHNHHTTHKVQIQGGGNMKFNGEDETNCRVWFASKFLVPFLQHAINV